MKKRFKPRELTLLGLLTALLLLMSYTPLGYLNIGPLAITFNMIPVAIAAAALGPWGGAFAGAVFGITSFLQCLGIGGTSAMGVILFELSPILAFIQRFVPRLLAGLLTGLIYKGAAKIANRTFAGFLSGFCAAFLNTALFMFALVILFGNTDYLQGLMAGKNVLLFIVTFVGINAVTGALCKALDKTGFLRR